MTTDMNVGRWSKLLRETLGIDMVSANILTDLGSCRTPWRTNRLGRDLYSIGERIINTTRVIPRICSHLTSPDQERRPIIIYSSGELAATSINIMAPRDCGVDISL